MAFLRVEIEFKDTKAKPPIDMREKCLFNTEAIERIVLEPDGKGGKTLYFLTCESDKNGVSFQYTIVTPFEEVKRQLKHFGLLEALPTPPPAPAT
jgi:hypothetical protein